MNTLKLGMLPWRADALKLRFGDYLNRADLPAVPRVYGHVKSNTVPWQMLGNDKYGDCVLAGASHETMIWSLATQKQLPNFTDTSVVQQYLQLTNGKDAGLDPISTAKWRVSTGLTDADGTVHKVKAFASINADRDLDIAAHVFGVCGIGFNLPDTAEAEFQAGKPWSGTSGTVVGGHYVPLVGRNSAGDRFVVTWGKLQAVKRQFWAKYFVGGVAYFSMEYLLASGFSPEGINSDQLDADLASLQTGD